MTGLDDACCFGANSAVSTSCRMNETRTDRHTERWNALQALKRAIVEGATRRYEGLVAAALASGATDEEIDLVAHQAIQALLTGAEEPLTPRDLLHSSRESSSRE